MTDDLSRTALEQAITAEQARLEDLEREQAETLTRLQALQARLTGLAEPANSPPAATPGMPAEEKVALFRRLFRGRPDVYPKRWENPRTGKNGYALVCRNEWIRGICKKPRVKCTACPNQAFPPISDEAIRDHLQGRCVLGVYPMLQDETCWFLAADFDKGTWQEDVAAFAATCRQAGVPAAIERSRSGNGAHVWIFFASPVAASVARQMGCTLLTRTMDRRHELSMTSYDRLFPNQDTMPRGGLGNLIALPLQKAARENHHTEFLDDNLVPFADQWAYLRSVRRMEPSSVLQIAADARRRGLVLGVRHADSETEEDTTPWNRLPSGRWATGAVREPLPPVVKAVLAQRLFIERDGLPSSLLSNIKRLAAFQNPEFYKKQGLRLSTSGTPRIISCAEDLPEHLALPRECRDELDALFRQHSVELAVEDHPTPGEPLDQTFHGTLTPVQSKAAKALLAHDTGVFVAPPGVGKTVVGTYLVSRRRCSTLILVHRRPLMDQWIAKLAMFLGVETKDIGQIGGGKNTANGRLDVAMLQSLMRDREVDDRVASYGHVIVDECHHVPAVSFEGILAEVKARFIIGLTATPQRRDGHHPILPMQLGPVRFVVDPKSPAAHQPFHHHLVVRETEFASPDLPIQQLYAAIAQDEKRNHLIVDDVLHAIERGRSPLLLTERRDHLELLAKRLEGRVHHMVTLYGSMSAKERRAAVARLESIPEGEPSLLLATGRLAGEGFDDPRRDTLLLAMPISWRGTLVQYAGRLHRLHPGKTEVRILDYVDRECPVLLRMFEKRLRGYRSIGYARGEAPLGFADDAQDDLSEETGIDLALQ